MRSLKKRIAKKNFWPSLACTVLLIIAGNVTAQQVPLEDLNAFQLPSKHWSIGGGIDINPLRKGSFKKGRGKGILIGATPQTNGSADIKTKMTHGDILLEFDVLLSHGASAVVWLQGRYGLRLTDKWNAETIRYSDNGALIPPLGESGGSWGYLPNMNSTRAPGVWQHIKIRFDAPAFDASGSKTNPARIVSVRQNGLVIQENQYLQTPGQGAPFTDEVAEGPLVFRIGKGDIAIRNIRYTKFTGKEVELEELTYRLYLDEFLNDEFVFWGGGDGDVVQVPEFGSYEANESGDLKSIHTLMARGLGNDFALVFEGKVRIPESGTYTFEAIQNGLGSFAVGGKELFRWNSIHGKGSTSSSIELAQGVHRFTLSYINHRQPYTGLYVEGMGVKRQPLHQESAISGENLVRPIVISPKDRPRIQRSFLLYGGKKLLSCINVGNPNGIHYSMDLSTGSLLQAWKGGFGDVTSMWHDRGEDQVLQPLGSVVHFTDKQQVLLSKDQNIQSGKQIENGDYDLIGYDLTQNGEPVFLYRVGNIEIRDLVVTTTSEKTLTRSLTLNNPVGNNQTVWFKIATAPRIDSVGDRLYSIGDRRYYVEVEEGEPLIQKDGEEQVLLVAVNVDRQPQELQYSLIW